MAKTYLTLESGVKKKKSWYEIKSFLKTVDCHADITVLTDAASLTKTKTKYLKRDVSEISF